jgi:mono/diheme cytochrome c family protein
MRGARLWLGSLGIAVFTLGTAAVQATELPAGANRDLVARECQACHDLDRVVDTHESREIWINLLDAMTSYGLQVSPEDRAKILDYLVTALGPQ